MVKDRLLSWFLRNVVIPKITIIDHPGFIATRHGLMTAVYIRQILMPESFLVDLENKIVKKYGEKGEQLLYSIGKKFGWRYAEVTNIPIIEKYDKKMFDVSAYFIVRVIECTYAERLSHKINLDLKEFDLVMDNYVVCRKNGKGYIFSSGGVAGIWAYAMQDTSIEGVQIKCQGRGDKKCEAICAPPEVLEKKGLKFFRETNLDGLEIDPMYEDMNKIRKPEYADTSFEDMINFGFFDYSRGVVRHRDERYFLCEATLPYLLELGLKKLKDGTKILFDCAFTHGERIGKLQGKVDPQRFMMQFLSASGWGDVLVLKSKGGYKVISAYFPWTKFAGDVKFEMYRGLVSGLLSGCLNKEIILSNVEVDTRGEGLTVILS